MNGNRYRFVMAGVLAFMLVGTACGSDNGDGAAPAEAEEATANGGQDCTMPDRVKLQRNGSSRRSSPATSPRKRRGSTPTAPGRRHHRGRCRHRAPAAAGGWRGGLRAGMGAEGAREPKAGANIVDIAQVFQRSGTLQVSFKNAGITTPADFAGKTIGNWGFGNEYEIFAALAEANLDSGQDVSRAATVRHARPPPRHRRGRGHDVQRVRAGARGREPRHRQALHARRPQRRVLRASRGRDAAGRDLGRRRTTWQRRLLRRHRRSFRRGIAAGWAYCRDNVQECATSWLPRGRSSATATSSGR